MQLRTRTATFAAVLTLGLTSICLPAAARISLERPGDREFVVDKADIIDQADEQAIKQMADKLLTEKAVPIIVVTIESMDQYGGRGQRIERFAQDLFDQWGIGHERLKINGQNVSWNNGILLLVSIGDRKARIELGADWGRSKNDVTQRIMDDLIVSEFKRGNFSSGILQGVKGLDAMARELELPAPVRPWWHYLLIVAFIGLAIFTIVSLVRRGSGGWAWVFWAAVFTVLGVILYHILTHRSRGGGGFGGGSFGGGFSGGGGATGSW